MDMESITGQMAAITVETSKMVKNKAKEYGDQVIKVNITKVHTKMERDRGLVFMYGKMV
jgi:hypothetical protein